MLSPTPVGIKNYAQNPDYKQSNQQYSVVKNQPSQVSFGVKYQPLVSLKAAVRYKLSGIFQRFSEKTGISTEIKFLKGRKLLSRIADKNGLTIREYAKDGKVKEAFIKLKNGTKINKKYYPGGRIKEYYEKDLLNVETRIKYTKSGKPYYKKTQNSKGNFLTSEFDSAGREVRVIETDKSHKVITVVEKTYNNANTKVHQIESKSNGESLEDLYRDDGSYRMFKKTDAKGNYELEEYNQNEDPIKTVFYNKKQDLKLTTYMDEQGPRKFVRNTSFYKNEKVEANRLTGLVTKTLQTVDGMLNKELFINGQLICNDRTYKGKTVSLFYGPDEKLKSGFFVADGKMYKMLRDQFQSFSRLVDERGNDYPISKYLSWLAETSEKFNIKKATSKIIQENSGKYFDRVQKNRLTSSDVFIDRGTVFLAN